MTAEYDTLLEPEPTAAPAASDYDVLLSEPETPPATNAPALRPPPEWSGLVNAPEFKALPIEDQSHAVEAWRETAAQYGKQKTPDWNDDHEQELGNFTNRFQEQLAGSVKFTGADRPYRHLANSVVFDPMRPADGMIQAARDGLIPKQPREKLTAALQAQQAILENKRLEELAGGSQEAKALAVGAGRGAAFFGGALPGAKAGALIGAAVPGLGETGISELAGSLIGGIGGGIVASEAYDHVLNRFAENDRTIAGALAAAELHPNISAAGELISFAVPTPIGIAKGIRRFQLVAENLGKKEAIKQAAKYVAVSGGIGAVSAPVTAAVDRFKNTALDLGHDPNASIFDPKSIAANTVLAIMLGNLGVKFTKFSAGEAASIHQRGMAGETLSKAEAEMFRTINRKIAQDPNSFVFEAEQATMGGNPLDGAAAARTKPNPTNPAAFSGRTTSGSAGVPPPRPGPQNSAGSPPPRSNNSAPPPQSSGPTAGTQAPPKARVFSTQDEFNSFMDEARSRGDVESAGEAWAINNAAGGKHLFSKWYNGGHGDQDVQWFANAVLHGKKNGAYAEFVRERKAASQGNGPAGAQRADPTSRARPDNAESAARSVTSGNGIGVQATGRRADTESVSSGRSGGSLVRRDASPRTNGSPQLSTGAAFRLPTANEILASGPMGLAMPGLASLANPRAFLPPSAALPQSPASSEYDVLLDDQPDETAAAAVPHKRAKSRGARAINEILAINGEAPKEGGKLYVVADREGAPVEVFTDHQAALEHLATMSAKGEWLWSVPADYSSEPNLEGGMPESLAPPESRLDDPDYDTPVHRGEVPLKDPFGVRFKGQGPTPSEETVNAPTESTVSGRPIEQVPTSEITLSRDVPQFKRGANSRGVVEPLQGEYDPTGNVLQGWRRLDGSVELISGRHRFAKALESGTPSVAMQIHNEADGFTARQAARLDAELNIRDGQGSIADYANYFRDSELTQAAAEQRGLLARAKGKAGFSIGRGASKDVFALHQSGEISDAQAQGIADAAPGNAELQRIGTRAALDGKSAAYVANLIKAVQARAKGDRSTPLDLFGNDDSAMREMDAQAKAASAEQKAIREQVRAVEGAAHKPTVAAKLGVNVSDPAGVQKRVAELKAELARWDNWPMHSDLLARTRGEATPARKATTPGPELVSGDATKSPEQLEREAIETDAALTKLQQAQDVRVGAARPLAAAEDIRGERDMFGADKAEGDDLFDKAKGMRRKVDADESGFVDADIFADLVDFGKRVFRKGMEFAEWAGEMVRHLGEKVATMLHRLWRSISGQNIRPEFRQSGAIFPSNRGRSSQPDAIGGLSRILSTRAFWEGSADVFLKKEKFTFLGKAINKQVDLADKHLGATTGKLEAWESRTKGSEQTEAKETLSKYIDARESNRPSDAANILSSASPAAADLIKTIGDIAEYTGKVSTTLKQPNGRTGVEVREGPVVRPLRNLGRNFWPRVLRGEYDAVLRDPLSDPARWATMINDLVVNGNAATAAEAEQFLKGGSNGNEAANEFLGSLYQARGGRLPAHWYDTTVEGFENWAVKWSDIVSKVEAFGQKIRPNDKDQFEVAVDLTTHAPTRSFIHSVQARAYNERNVGPAAKYLLDAPRLLASGLFLTNPVTIGINAISAKVMNTFTYGVGATWMRNPLAAMGTKNHLDAYALGVLKRDMVRLLYRDDLPGLDGLKSFVNGAMKISGYQVVENMTRVDSYLTALAFLCDGLAAVRRKPTGSGSMQFMAYLKRNGHDVAAIVRENGTGEATDSFLRGTIRDTQGGYAYNQVPWWTDTPLGRVLLQFSKFGAMHTRNVMHNVIKPAFVGTTVSVKVNGKTVSKRVFNVRPLLYFLAGTVGGGEAIALLKDKAFGVERKDATLEEIANTMDESTRDGLVLLAIRALNDSLTMGMLGIFGTPIQSVRDVTERSRYRNPLAPPGVSLATNGAELLQTGWEQGQITGRDVEKLLKSTVTAYRYADAFLKEQAVNAGIQWDAAKLKERQDNVAFLRAASNRYAEEVGLPPQRVTTQGRRAKDETSPMRQDLLEALTLGNKDDARTIVESYLREFPSIAEQTSKLRGLSMSVDNNQPVRVGGIAGNERRIEFMAWARQKLKAEDVARIEAVDSTYRNTANAVGLMRLQTEREERKMQREIGRESRQMAARPSEAEQEAFFNRSLGPQRSRRRR